MTICHHCGAVIRSRSKVWLSIAVRDGAAANCSRSTSGHVPSFEHGAEFAPLWSIDVHSHSIDEAARLLRDAARRLGVSVSADTAFRVDLDAVEGWSELIELVDETDGLLVVENPDQGTLWIVDVDELVRAGRRGRLDSGSVFDEAFVRVEVGS